MALASAAGVAAVYGAQAASGGAEAAKRQAEARSIHQQAEMEAQLKAVRYRCSWCRTKLKLTDDKCKSCGAPT